jgi:alkylhydroperoxidase family enzyme
MIFVAGLSGMTLVGCEPTSMSTKMGEDSLHEVPQETAIPQKTTTFTQRLTTPRIPPLPEEGRTPEQQALLDSRPDFNLFKTLAHHVELYDRWTPLGNTLLNGSTLPARDREIIILRMGWLCQSEYEWSQHARIATSDGIGMTIEEVLKIASNPSDNSWSDFEQTLMKMVDELRYDTMITDETWSKLSARYSQQEIIDAIFTAAQYQLVSMVLNSTGIQLDPILEHRLPTNILLPQIATVPQTARLSSPRVKPLLVADMSDEQKRIAANQIREDGTLLNLYGTMINHPALYGPRYTFGSYILRETSLPAATRELLIMRTGWLMRAEYEWAHHLGYAKQAGLTDADILRIAEGPKAEGWSENYRAVLQAADELRAEAFIHNDTWAILEKYYDTKQLVELVFTVGGYSMTALAINSLGIQLEDDSEGFPQG